MEYGKENSTLPSSNNYDLLSVYCLYAKCYSKQFSWIISYILQNHPHVVGEESMTEMDKVMS